MSYFRWRTRYYFVGLGSVRAERDGVLAQGYTRLVCNAVLTTCALQSALRQMVYLVIKELSKVAEDVIMVTSSIMKDMQPNLEVIYRPNAIRALCRVIDVRRFPSLYSYRAHHP